ncbi:uncharacterized protein LOC109727012 isoform X1 [Ananas comosus]|uniref:Uncharacterized protein LOC109727012 isoform X1 n=1 Tax=Ananas comosus TaxID=4615 RepID=A0A6P5GX76_ANACO|nr:uncharacterized protein LOC109727012 isoform X1 [Ananas comosus]
MQSGAKKKPRSSATTTSSGAGASAGDAAVGVRHAWAELPDALLVSILGLLLSHRDLLSFSSVCRSWRVLATTAAPLRHLPPLLLRPSHLTPLLRRHRNPNPTFNLLDPSSPHSVARSSPLSPQTLSLPFLGLSHGRLILLLSVTGAELRTPPLPPPNTNLHFGLLTAPLAAPESSLLLLGYDSFLFQWRPGSPEWLRTPFRVAPTITHIVPFEGRVLAMDDAERLFVIHLAGDADSCVTELEVSWVGQKIAPFSLCRYLIVCGSELLLVRFVPSKMMLHLGIEALRLDRLEPWRWVKMESLGDRALFIGENYRTLGFSCDSPKKWGGESNSIYYAGSGNQPWSVLRLGDAAIDLSDPELTLIKDGSPLSRTPKWFYPSLYGGGQGHGALRASEPTA